MLPPSEASIFKIQSRATFLRLARPMSAILFSPNEEERAEFFSFLLEEGLGIRGWSCDVGLLPFGWGLS